jgi:predicted carbohydrate-binding protein with CBM48
VFEGGRDVVDQIVARLRRPVRIDPSLDGRVMERIAALPTPRRTGAVTAAWRWLTEPRRVALSPLSGLAVAAGLVALAVLLPALGRRSTPSIHELQFVLVAPHANAVALIGDFNDWDAARTPMRLAHAGGTVWTTVVPLSPGRYRYAFLVNGSRWLADPAAPAALDNDYGDPSSVVTVAGS